MTYKGRFAPSPSGRLHFGSVVCAVAVFLRAKSQNGQCILRIEDLDEQRCSTENTKAIITELDSLGFDFDGDVYIQSEHKEKYFKFGEYLYKNKDAFYCNCTRALLKQRPCPCFSKNLTKSDETALFYKVKEKSGTFLDNLKGKVFIDNLQDSVCLIRKDNIISYNLACVVDDIQMGITEIARGSDLTDITPVQIEMFKAFKSSVPEFMHIPLALMDKEHKLSKQNHSKAALDILSPEKLLIKALEFLNQDTASLSTLSCKDILKKALDRFDYIKIGKESSIVDFS